MRWLLLYSMQHAMFVWYHAHPTYRATLLCLAKDRRKKMLRRPQSRSLDGKGRGFSEYYSTAQFCEYFIPKKEVSTWNFPWTTDRVSGKGRGKKRKSHRLSVCHCGDLHTYHTYDIFSMRTYSSCICCWEETGLLDKST